MISADVQAAIDKSVEMKYKELMKSNRSSLIASHIFTYFGGILSGIWIQRLISPPK
jgi:hypothetical protein